MFHFSPQKVTKLTKRTSNCENIIDDEHLLITFKEHYKTPIVLLVLSDSDDRALYPMLKCS